MFAACAFIRRDQRSGDFLLQFAKRGGEGFDAGDEDVIRAGFSQPRGAQTKSLAQPTADAVALHGLRRRLLRHRQTETRRRAAIGAPLHLKREGF